MSWWHPLDFFFGLDVGQANDYTALAIVERVLPTREEVQEHEHDGRRVRRKVAVTLPSEYHVRQLERMRRVPYPDLVAQVRAAIRDPRLAERSKLIIDYAGPGRPIFDMFRAAGSYPVALTVHAGSMVTSHGDEIRLPKRDLIGALQVFLQSKRLAWGTAVPNAAVLEQELANYRVRISETGHDSYGSAREEDHDDLLFACGLAVWYGEWWWRVQPTYSAASRSYFTTDGPADW